MSEFWYLASPYSKFPNGLEAAFRVAVQACGLFVKAKIPVFSPIVHCHFIADDCHIDPHDHLIWLPAMEPIMRRARGLIMLRAMSWEQSHGMRMEQLEFAKMDKITISMDPGVIPEILVHMYNLTDSK